MGCILENGVVGDKNRSFVVDKIKLDYRKNIIL